MIHTSVTITKKETDVMDQLVAARDNIDHIN
jgi:hypothetical protein